MIGNWNWMTEDSQYKTDDRQLIPNHSLKWMTDEWNWMTIGYQNKTDDKGYQTTVAG